MAIDDFYFVFIKILKDEWDVLRFQTFVIVKIEDIYSAENNIKSARQILKFSFKS